MGAGVQPEYSGTLFPWTEHEATNPEHPPQWMATRNAVEGRRGFGRPPDDWINVRNEPTGEPVNGQPEEQRYD